MGFTSVMIDDTLTKRKPLHLEDAKAQFNHKTDIVLGRIYGLSHLLSSERLLNISQMQGDVKQKTDQFKEKNKKKRRSLLF